MRYKVAFILGTIVADIGTMVSDCYRYFSNQTVGCDDV